jgi:hypothetical protein
MIDSSDGKTLHEGKALVLVTTPLHFFNSMELLNCKNKRADLVVVDNTSSSRVLFDFLKNNYGKYFDEFLFLKGFKESLWRTPARYLKSVLQARVSLDDFIKGKKYCCLIFGHSADAATICSYLKEKVNVQSFIVDDGEKTLRFLSSPEYRKRIVENRKKRTMGKVLKDLFFTQCRKYQLSSIFFTAYASSIEGEEIKHEKNNYTFFKKTINSKSIEKNAYHILGQPLYKNYYLGEENYLFVLKCILSNLDKSVVYFPHPKESDKFVNKLKKLYNVDVIRPQCGYELYLCNGESRPLKIISFFTSVVPVLHDLGINNGDMVAIDVSDMVIDVEKKKIAKSYYNFLYENKLARVECFDPAFIGSFQSLCEKVGNGVQW